MKASLPSYARLPINRCNLPAVILGSLSFQQHPTTLLIDGVHQLHKSLFETLDSMDDHAQRASYFIDYMVVHFRLHNLEEVGVVEGDSDKRINADYLRLLRGWLFDPDGREGAVLKSWVESRFGLLTRYHKTDLGGYDNEDYQVYIQERANGLYATNALESQIDLLYSYCQYELGLIHHEQQRITLYRGVNRIDNYEILEQKNKSNITVLLNNLNSFSLNENRAGEFGDYILQTEVPWQKILFFSNLLPGIFKGEEEMLVIGGVYAARVSY